MLPTHGSGTVALHPPESMWLLLPVAVAASPARAHIIELEAEGWRVAFGGGAHTLTGACSAGPGLRLHIWVLWLGRTGQELPGAGQYLPSRDGPGAGKSLGVIQGEIVKTLGFGQFSTGLDAGQSEEGGFTLRALLLAVCHVAEWITTRLGSPTEREEPNLTPSPKPNPKTQPKTSPFAEPCRQGTL